MTPEAMPFHWMARNNAWANQTLFSALTDAPPACFHMTLPGFFPTLCRTTNHIYEVDLYYVDALEAGDLGRSVYQRDDVQSPSELAIVQAVVDRRLIEFCAALDNELLAETRKTERKETACVERVDALLLHLFQHQVHHRGQAHTQLHSADITPPQLDDFYLTFGRVPSAQAYYA